MLDGLRYNLLDADRRIKDTIGNRRRGTCGDRTYRLRDIRVGPSSHPEIAGAGANRIRCLLYGRHDLQFLVGIHWIPGQVEEKAGGFMAYGECRA